MTFRSIAIYFLSSFLAFSLAAQQPALPNLTASLPGLGAIDLANLNVSLTFPIINKPGRGVDYTLALTYNGDFWDASGNQWEAPTGFGWSYIPNGVTGNLTWTTTAGGPCNHPGLGALYTTTTTARTYIDSYGIGHQFAGTKVVNPCTGSESLYPTLAMSDGYSVDANNVVYDAGGVPVMSGTIQDTNGNSINLDDTNPTDTLGTTPLLISGVGPFYNPGQQPTSVFQYQDTSGNRQSIQVIYEALQVKTNFGVPNVAEWTSSTAISFVQRIVYPDREYDFNYEQTPGYPGYTTGRISSVTLPETGVVYYKYNGATGSLLRDNLTSRIEVLTSDNTSPTVYALSATDSGPETDTVVTVAHPLGSVDSYNFSSVLTGARGSNVGDSRLFVLTSSVVGDKTTNICYSGGVGTTYSCAATGIINPISSTTTVTGRNGINMQRVDNYNSVGELTETDEYDYSSSSSYTLLRKTLKTYNTGLVKIQNRQSTSQVLDGVGNQISYEVDTYDQYPLVDNPSTPTTNLPGYSAWSEPRGNLTSKGIWLNTDNSSDTTSYHYDNAGVLQYEILPETGAQVSFKYDSTDAFVTEIDTPAVGGVTLTKQAQHDLYTGLLTQETDANSHITLYTYGSTLRLNSVTRDFASGGDGGVTSFSYPNAQTDISSSTIAAGSGATATFTLVRDAYGRRSRRSLANGQGSGGAYITDTCYNGDGQQAFASNRYQGSLSNSVNCSGNGDTFTYDGHRRLSAVTHADGSSIAYAYYGKSIKVVDEGNGSRSKTLVTEMDGLGRPKSVCEYVLGSFAVGSTPVSNCALDINTLGPDKSQPAMTTSYTYSSSSTASTIQSNQAGQLRTWTKDSFGRKTSETIPESSGTATYSYSSSSSGFTRTRVRPQANQTSTSTTTTTTATFDILGRPTGLSYSGGGASDSASSITYDTAPTSGTLPVFHNTLGRPVTLTKGNISQFLSYTSNGSPEWTDTCVPITCNTSAEEDIEQTFQYDLLGRLASWSDGYTGADTLSYTIADELTSASNTWAGAYINNVSYGPDGPLSITYDTRTAQVQRDVRGRVTGVGLYSATNNLIYGYGIAWAPNGQVSGSCDNASGTFTNGCAATSNVSNPIAWSYTYDELNRLTDAAMSNGSSERSYQYDGWGNRWNEQIVAGSGMSPSNYSFNNNNQITSPLQYQYDAAGNLIAGITAGALNGYAYDAEGRVVSAYVGGSTTTYTYGPDGNRSMSSVTVLEGGAQPGRPRTQTSSHSYIYGPGGVPSSIWDDQGAFFEGPRYLGTQKLGYIDTLGNFSYTFETLQGSSGYSDNSSAVAQSLPYGESLPVGADADTIRFAGMEWDSSSGLANGTNRQYAPSASRWMSPDPYDGSYDANDPQTFNRYTYASNSPLTNIDPLGLAVYSIGDMGGIPQYDYTGGDNLSLSPCISDPDACSVVHEFFNWLVRHLGSNVNYQNNQFNPESEVLNGLNPSSAPHLTPRTSAQQQGGLSKGDVKKLGKEAKTTFTDTRAIQKWYNLAAKDRDTLYDPASYNGTVDIDFIRARYAFEFAKTEESLFRFAEDFLATATSASGDPGTVLGRLTNLGISEVKYGTSLAMGGYKASFSQQVGETEKAYINAAAAHYAAGWQDNL